MSACCADYALPGRRKVRAVGYLCAAQRRFGYVIRVSIDGLTVDEVAARSYGDRTGVVRVAVIEISIVNHRGAA